MDAEGDFIIVWESFNQEDGLYDIYARQYKADGIPQGDEFRVNRYTSDTQQYPKVAMDGDGDFVITWQNKYQDGSNFGVYNYNVYARRYRADGTSQDDEFRVNALTTEPQTQPGAARPDVAMDLNGDFVIVWASYYEFDSPQDFNLHARRYKADGVPQDSEFQVNNLTDGRPRSPSVAMDADGDFVIAWESFYDIFDSDIYARRYVLNGVPQGNQFQVNNTTTSSQTRPSVAMSADGDFVIAWESNYSRDIYARRYETPGLTLSKQVDNVIPQAGERIIYTLTVNSKGLSTTDVVISDTLPLSLTLAGPITLDPPGAGTPGNSGTLPIVASNITLAADEEVKVTIPVTVEQGLIGAVSNIASISSTEITIPETASITIFVNGQALYIPLIMKEN